MSFVGSSTPRDHNTTSNTTTFLLFNPNDMQFGTSSFHEDLDASFLNLLNLKDNNNKNENPQKKNEINENEQKFYDERNIIKNNDFPSNKNNFNFINNRNQEQGNNFNLNERQINDGEQFGFLKEKEARFLEDKIPYVKYDAVYSQKNTLNFYRNSDTQIKNSNLNDKMISENQSNDLFLRDNEHKPFEERQLFVATDQFHSNFHKNFDGLRNLNSNNVNEKKTSDIDKFNERFKMLNENNLLGTACSPGKTERKIEFPTIKGNIAPLTIRSSEEMNYKNNEINMNLKPEVYNYSSPYNFYVSDNGQKNDVFSEQKNDIINAEKNKESKFEKNARTNSIQDWKFVNNNFTTRTMTNFSVPNENYKVYYPDNAPEANYEYMSSPSKKIASTNFLVEKEKKTENMIQYVVSPPKIINNPVNIKKSGNFEPIISPQRKFGSGHVSDNRKEELNLFRKPDNIESNVYQIRDIKPPVIEKKQPVIYPKQNEPQMILKKTQVGSPLDYDLKQDFRQKNQADSINYSSKMENVSTTIKEIDDLLDKLAPIRKYYETKKSTKNEISNQTSTSSGTCHKNVVTSEEIDSFSRDKMLTRQNESFSKEKNNVLQKVISKLERSMYNRYRDLPKLLFSMSNFFKNVLNNSSDSRMMSADIKESEEILKEIMLTFDHSDFLKTDWIICCRGVNICKEKLKMLKFSNLSGSFSREINTSLILSNELEKLEAIDSFTMLDGYDLEN